MLNRILVLIAVVLVLAGCKTIVPPSDSTPPKLQFYIRIGDGPFESVPASGTDVNLPCADKIYLWAIASDAEGVKSVTILGEGTVHCQRGDLGQIVHITYYSNNSEHPDVGVGDVTETVRSVLMELGGDLSSYCTGGFDFKNGSATLLARARNFHAGVTQSGTVTLKQN